MSAGHVTAQTFTNLYNFAGSGDKSGADPCGALILSGGTLYGTTYYGGTNNDGTVFAINTNGSDYNLLHSFNYGNASDGAYPYFGNLVQSGSTIYGAAYQGGTNDVGMVFAINTDGTGFTNLYSFTYASSSDSYTNSDGAYPYSTTLALSSGGTLYGAATYGGTNGTGTIFAINTNGTGYTVLHTFSPTVNIGNSTYTNSEGAYPVSGLTLSDGILYGTTYFGGTNGGGTVFALSTNGGTVTVLHAFGTAPQASPDTNSDGAFNYCGLILSGSTLYGTSTFGGTNGHGTIFSVNTNGAFSLLHTFSALNSGSNSDGAYPYIGNLILSGNTLYGTAEEGGSGTNGTVFSINTDGADFTVIHAFTRFSASGTNSDGATPYGGLLLSGNMLYGTAESGGLYDDGTVFAITLPSLSLALSGNQLILTWPTNVTFTLQSATNLLAPVVWNTVSTTPTIVNGQYTVTNAVSGKEMFYRLTAP